MAFDKVIDSGVLNNGLTAIANAIRSKGGTTEKLVFPDGFVSAIFSIISNTPDIPEDLEPILSFTPRDFGNVIDHFMSDYYKVSDVLLTEEQAIASALMLWLADGTTVTIDVCSVKYVDWESQRLDIKYGPIIENNYDYDIGFALIDSSEDSASPGLYVGRYYLDNFYPGWTKVAICSKAEATAYGVEWDYSQSNTKLTRTGSAATFADPIPAKSLTAIGTSPFDNIMPWAGMRKATLSSDQMVYIPEFYYHVSEDKENSKIKWQISPVKKKGFTKHPGSGRYISRYHTSAGYKSVSGVMPIGGQTRATFRENSHAKGANWWLNDVATWSAIQLLYLVEFADWNCQIALGKGQTSGSMVKTGGTDTATYHTIKLDDASHQYRWIENPYSNIRDWLDGSVNVSNRVYVGTDNTTFGDTVDGYTDTGLTIPTGSANYPTRLGISEAAPWMFIPVEAGGSGSTFIPDHSISGNNITLRVTGGKYTYGDGWGLFKYDSNDPVNFTAEDVGARLIYVP